MTTGARRLRAASGWALLWRYNGGAKTSGPRRLPRAACGELPGSTELRCGVRVLFVRPFDLRVVRVLPRPVELHPFDSRDVLRRLSHVPIGPDEPAGDHGVHLVLLAGDGVG